MAERILAILILCVAIAAPFGLVWLTARDLWTDFVVIHPSHASVPRGMLAAGGWYDAALNPPLQS